MAARLSSSWIVIAILTFAAIGLRLWDPGPVRQLRHLAFDTYQRLAPRDYNPDLPVRIVDIDDASLERYGQWPWPRTRLAELVDKLNAMGAAAIGFDFVFSEPDRSSPEQILADFPPGPELEQLSRILANRTSNDEIFARALAGGNSILGTVLNNSGGGMSAAVKAGFSFAGDDPVLFAPRFTGITGNLENLEAAANGVGSLNWVPDGDQIVRRLPLLTSVDGQLYPSFTTELLRVAQGASSYLAKSSGASEEEAFGAQTGIVAVRVGAVTLPTAANGEMWLHFTGHQKARSVPAWKVLSGEVAADAIAGRIVLVGTSAPGLFDLRATPLNAAIPGIEVHAEGLGQMLSGATLVRPDFAIAVELIALVVAGLIIAVFIGFVGPQWTALAALAALGGANWVSWTAFSQHGWLIDPVYPTLMTATVYVAGTVTGYLRTSRERDQVRSAFGRYLAPSIVEDLAKNPHRLELGGEEKELTILFSDIRGFTAISETMDPTRLTEFINRFLTPMTEEILQRSGTIDKYMGDAVMAFWNAPLTDPDHATNACNAALAMRSRLAQLNIEFAAEATQAGPVMPPVRIGIGLNTGPACVGNLGSKQRFAYSAIGDDVNVASRLEGQTKTYGVDIIVSAATVKAAPGFAYLELDRLKVQGRKAPVGLFALIGDQHVAASNSFIELNAANSRMRVSYCNRDWRETLKHLKSCQALGGKDLEFYYAAISKRIAAYKRRPPRPDWDGSVAAKGK